MKDNLSGHHICHIQTTFKTGAGATRRTIAVLRGLKKTGCNISLIVGVDSENIQELQEAGISVYMIPELRKHISFKNELIVLYRLARILRQIRPDIVHTHLAKAGILGRVSSIIVGTPIILHTVHGPSFPESFNFFKRTLFKCLEFLVSKKTDRFIFVGKELKNLYIEKRISKESNSIVIRTARPKKDFDFLYQLCPESVIDIRKSITNNENCFLMIYVGRIVPSKQQEHAISILKQLRESGYNVELIFVGVAFIDEEKKYQLYLEKLVAEFKLGQYVHFAGYQSNVLELMAVSDVVILTSKYEGMPNVLTEAAMVGTPFISYEVSGIVEFTQYVKNVITIKQSDIEDFVRQLCLLIKQRDVSQDIKDKDIESSKYQYFEEDMVEQKINYYKIILSERQVN
ncbi:MAG: glycosyltransferase [Desulfobacteraceae bacterium]|nr:glycosyltransferase [Desulfobacteraceae bacterium]